MKHQITIDKKRVEQCFRKSIDTYNQHAIVQKYICETFLQTLIERCGNTFFQALEIGAGTGLLTEQLIKQCSIKNLYINDLVPSAKEPLSRIFSTQIQIEPQYIIGDAEKLQLPTNNNLIISTSAVQWFENLALFLKNIEANLCSNGILAFTTFGINNMQEISTIEGNSLSYLSFPELKTMIEKHFEILWMIEEQIPLYFASPKDILQHIKQTGVNGVEPTHWTKNDLLNFVSAYKQFFVQDKGYVLTYHPVYVICRKL